MPAPDVNIKTDPPLDGAALAAADRFQVGSQAANRWRAIEATELLRGLFLVRSVPGVLADLGLDVALAGKAPLAHSHPFSDLGDGREVVEDYVAAMFTGGTHSGVSVGYVDNGAAPGTINLTSAGVPGGATTQVQFNDGGAFAGDSVLTWDKTNKRLGVGAAAPAAGLEVRSGATGTPTVVARAVVSQTADLTQWQNSSGSVIARMAYDGRFTAGAVAAGAGGLAVTSVPAGGQVRLDAYDTGPNFLTTTNVLDLGDGDQPYTGYLLFSTDGYGVARLGWGTNAPAYPIHVDTTQPQIKLGYGVGAGYDSTLFGDSGGLALDTFTGGSHRLQVGGTTRMFVGATGVGLGTSSPTARLDVRTGATTTIGQVIRAATSQTADLQQWQNSSGTTNAALGADFSLKLNATTSAWKPALWVSDNNTTLGAMLFFEYRGGAANNKLHAFSADASGLGVYRLTDAGTAFVRAGNLPDLLIDAAGKVGVGTNAPAAALDVRSVAAATVGQVVRGAASQSADLTQWQLSDGTVLAKVNASGVPTFPSGSAIAGVTATVAAPYTWQEFASGSRWGVRQAGGSGGVWCYGGGEAGPTAALAVQPTTTANNGVWVRGLASQSADLTQWQDSTGAVVAAVTSDGRVGVGTAPASGSMFHIKMPGTKQGFVVTNGDSTGTQTWFGFTTGSGPLGTGNDEYVNFYKDGTGWIWNSDKGGTGTARSVRWTHAGTERMRFDATGIGFFGKSAAAQQAGGAATAGGTYGATEQGMLQKAYDALRTFGLLS